MTTRTGQLKSFLVEANKKGYAGEGLEVDPLLPGFREHEYRSEDGLLFTRDFHTGLYTGGGFQIVWYDGKPYWMMIRGGGLGIGYHSAHPLGFESNEQFAKAVFRFQRKMLGQSPESMPVRGPIGVHREGPFEYRNSVIGDITHFMGQEVIIYHERHDVERNVYTLDYKGFLIIPI